MLRFIVPLFTNLCIWLSKVIEQILRHRYKIIKHLGSGGFGETFVAEDLDIPANPKPKCVVKRLQAQMMHPEIVRLFEKEGEILYRLGQNHNQIPTLFAYFQEEGEFYLVQELIDGHDLSLEIYSGNQWNEFEVIQLLQEILELLVFVHENNVIHRDIKPSNIMRRQRDGKIVLIDFGVVKQVSTQIINVCEYTSRTVAIGTPGYIPSEQAVGKPKFSSDIYAVGMTAIFALTGIPPYLLPEDNNGEVIWQNCAQVSDALAEILTKMVRYDFRQRYADANEAFQVLNQFVETRSPRIVSPIPIKIGDKYGYIDLSGLVIQPQFDDASCFCEELAVVKVDEKYGYIDKSGRFVIPPQFDRAWNFSEGLAGTKINNKWGYIDKSGRFVIPPQFDNYWQFSEGLVIVRVNEKYGYNDKSGKLVIQPQFDYAWGFSEGLAGARINNKWGYIDKSGHFVIPPQFDYAWDFFEGLAKVEINDKYGYIDKSGHLIITEPQFNHVWDFSEGLVIFRVDEKYGYIDKSGQLVIQPQFGYAQTFSEGLASAYIGDKGGYIDKSGQLVIQPQFDEAEGFCEGLATVKISDKWGYIDKNGQLVIQPQFDGAGCFSDGIAKIRIGDQERYIDKTGRFIY